MPYHSHAGCVDVQWTDTCPHRGARWSFAFRSSFPSLNHQATGGVGNGESDVPGSARKAATIREAGTTRSGGSRHARKAPRTQSRPPGNRREADQKCRRVPRGADIIVRDETYPPHRRMTIIDRSRAPQVVRHACTDPCKRVAE